MKTITIRLQDHLIEELPEDESLIYETLNLNYTSLISCGGDRKW
jgi:hypothetical protein